MKRLLVTGATGSIGRHVIPRLTAAGWDVHGVSSKPHGPQPGEAVTWHVADLLRPADVEPLVAEVRATHLLHLAWYLAPGGAHGAGKGVHHYVAPENYAWLEASVRLLRLFRAHEGRRAVVAGSCLEYDWRYGYCSEALTPCAPHTVYGACKHALQIAAAAMNAAGEFGVAWPRIFFTYGPHEQPERLTASVARALIEERPALCSHGQQVRDYVYVEDVADALVRLLESDLIGPINLASGAALRLKDIVERIGALTGRSDLVRLGAIPAAPTDTPVVLADVRRMNDELRWQPTWSLDAGLTKTIDWWRAQLQEASAKSAS
jgi:nucleoside-diphosphate-sugar epimerase